MALLAGTAYDPASSVSKDTATLAAMTAIDTTNLRLVFTAPPNGAVLVRLKGTLHGATTYPQILMGILDGSTVKARQAPMSARAQATATSSNPIECEFVVTGLTAGQSYTWDAAYGVEIVLASTGLKYGGPNDTTTNNAFGAFEFSIWETTNLLAATLYDPGTAVTSNVVSSNLAMTAFDTTNLRLTFTTTASGLGSSNALVHMRGVMHGSNAWPSVLMGVLDGSTVRGRVRPQQDLNDSALGTTTQMVAEAVCLITGLTPSTSYTWDAAYGVELLAASVAWKYGGPNNATTNDAWGGFSYAVWGA